MDLYLPENPGGESPGFPIIFFIHGGGWATGSKSELTPEKMEALSQGRYAVVSTDYSLYQPSAPSPLLPWIMKDIASNIKWLQDNSTYYHLNSSSITLIGYSAGAHLAALLALDKTYSLAAAVERNSIEKVCCIDGGPYMYDAQTLFDDTYSPESTSLAQAWKNVAGANSASWENYVPAKVIDPKSENADFLLIYSDIYDIRKIPNENFMQTLEAANVNVKKQTFSFEHLEFQEKLGSDAYFNEILFTFVNSF
jgi:pimeloyl-ACP methyl ester carboxylesterase